MERPDLTMVDTWHGFDREACVVTIPDGHEYAGTWSGELGARLLDEATGDGRLVVPDQLHDRAR